MDKNTEKLLRSLAIKERVAKEIGEMRDWSPKSQAQTLGMLIHELQREHLIELTLDLYETIQVVHAQKIDAICKMVAQKGIVNR